MIKYRIDLAPPSSAYEVGELVKMFLKKEEFEITENNIQEALDPCQSFSVVRTAEGDSEAEVSGREGGASSAAEGKASCEVRLMPEGALVYSGSVPQDDERKAHRNAVKRGIYQIMSRETGKTLPWGILTGVKPVKIVRELSAGLKLSRDEIRSFMQEYYLVSEEKTELLLEILSVQDGCCGESEKPEAKAGVYLGIPFCPSRCVYCSFTSNVPREGEIDRYLKALYREIEAVSAGMKAGGIKVESFYIGGGTPTTLDERQLDELLDKIFSCFDLEGISEFTVEAGRPDTITREKLEIIRRHGIERISINPQTMNGKTLELIGRKHSPEDIEAAFLMAKRAGITTINMDLIAGLPGEGPEDFALTMEKISQLRPENVTVHTLALKRASRLREEDEEYNYREAERLASMVELSADRMRVDGYRPYYMYRQKYMAGNFENVGYSLEGHECVFNIRTMDERQSVVALGAGGISKRYFPAENRIERAANVSNYEIYIERTDEMIARKAELFGFEFA